MDTPQNPAFAPIEDSPGLPRVLLLGDSISIGYTPGVRELLAGKANVHRPPENCADTATALRRLPDWLGHKKWNVVHFNFGLHDLKHIDDDRNLVDPAVGRRVASLAVYEENLHRIVGELKKTGATLIWCATTPVPANSAGRIEGDEKKYNAIAAGIMAAQDIPTDDLWSTVNNADPALQLPNNVHFTPEGYVFLARAVVDEFEAALARR